jgi:LysM repeat protein
MEQSARSPQRFLAPIALLVAVVVVVIVVSTSLTGGDGDGKPTDVATQAPSSGAGTRGGDKDGGGPSTYEVESGDTLDAIAEETGVSVEELLELNPDVDPEALSTGQELKLRE